MNIGFGTVVYKSAMGYCNDFLQTINEQCNKDFQLIIINDDLNAEELSSITKNANCLVNVYTPETEHTIPYLRVDLLIYAKKIGIDLLVIGDFDDEHDSNRIQFCVDQYDPRYTFYYNDITYMDKTPYFTDLPKVANNIDVLLEKNFLGMSNTAIDLSKLSLEYLESLKQGKTNIFDWYLFSRLLADGFTGKLVKGTATRYRIHGENIIGQQKLSNQQIEKEINVKLKHYRLLLDSNPKYSKLLEQYKVLQDHRENIEPYINRENSYWWGYIRISNQ